jgi:phosphoglucosamine mutase
MMPSFGSSGVRGPWDGEVTPAYGRRLGAALGDLHDDLLVTRDGRTSSPALAEAVAAGAAGQGAAVTRAGVASTPATAYAARDHDAAVVVTASHNPPSDAGYKLWTPSGRGYAGEALEAVTDRLQNPPSPAGSTGPIREGRSPADDHVETVLEAVPTTSLDLSVVVDGGHGPAGPGTARILRALGADVSTLHAPVDGAFPGRPSEPAAENLADLRAAVAETGADLGLAHDGDGDRLAAVDGRGRPVPPDALLALLARATGAEAVACPVDASKLVDDALEAAVHRTAVGDVHVSAALEATGAGFGGEASGCWIFPDLHLAPDGPRAAAELAALADEATVADRVDALPSYPIERTSIEVPQPMKETVTDAAGDALADRGPVDRTDGVRVDAGDGWVLVRPSGTEPVVRVTAEADEAKRARQLREAAVRAVEDAREATG